MRSKSNSVCPYLWNHHCVMVGNAVVPCCNVDLRVAKKDGVDWKNARVSDGIMSEDHKLTRQQMRNDEYPEICRTCWDLEAKELFSPRMRQLIKHPGILYDYEPTHPESMDIKFNNSCNLACRMCSPSSSSLVEQLALQLDENDRFENQKFFLPRNNFAEDEKLEIAKKHVRNGATEFKTTGGEPFVQPHFIEFVDWCIDHGYNSQLNLKITTNLIGLNSKLLTKLSTFKSIKINVSIDGYAEVYEYIRYPAEWNKIHANIKKCIKLRDKDNFDITFSILLQIYNIFNVNKLVQYLKSMDVASNKISIVCKIKPSGLSELDVSHLPKNIIEQAINENQIPNVNAYLTSINATELGNTIKLRDFARKTVAYDRQRNQSYKILDKRIVGIIENHL